MKGYIRMLEVVFAGLILVMFLLGIAATYNRATSSDIGLRFSDVLVELNDMEILRALADDNNYSGIESEIIILGFEDAVEICNRNGNCVGNSPEIRENVWVSSYFLGGVDSYSPREVRLYVWRVSA
jgi:hypothetical protein